MPIWSSEIKELETLYHSLKGKIPDLEKELMQLIETQDANVALLYSRRSLEVIITDVCERELKRPRGTEPLKGIIDKLNREGKVPHNIIASMQNINSLSTFGTHPKDFKPRQVKPVLLDLTTVLEWYLEYMAEQELVGGESEVVQGKRKEPASLIKSWSKSRKRIMIVTGILLSAAIIIFSLIVLDITGIGKQARAGSIKSIVILPFTNYCEESYETLISGMHAYLIADIGRLSGLQVINPITSNVYKNAGKTVHEITEELKVDAAIGVSVHGILDSVLFEVSLIKEFPKEKTIWSREYKEEKSKLLYLFNQITKQIAYEINIELTPTEEADLAESRAIEPDAMDAYMRGYYYGDLREESLIKALNNLNYAIEKEPDFAPLFAMRADVWGWLSFIGYEQPEIVDSIMYENVNTALSLDPDLADAHRLIAGRAGNPEERNWEKSENEYLKALAINPNNAASHMGYSILLYILQRPDEAKRQADLGYKLDPLNPIIQYVYELALLCGRNYSSALSFAENLLATDPTLKTTDFDYNLFYSFIENAALGCGNLTKLFEATEHYITYFLLFKEEEVNEIQRIYNEKGFIAAYTEIIRQLQIQVDKGYPRDGVLAFYYYVINQDDKAIEYLEKEMENIGEGDQYIGTGFIDYSRLYDNPRFIALLKKMNIPLPKTD